MDQHACDLRRASHRQLTRAGRRHRARLEGAGTDLGREARDSKSGAGPKSRRFWIGRKYGGYREGENPARWRGHLDKLLPARAKVRKVEHHAALPYAEIGAGSWGLCAEQEGDAARALEFAILTAARTGEVIGARRSEPRSTWQR